MHFLHGVIMGLPATARDRGEVCCQSKRTPTAVLKSVGKINNVGVILGLTLNMKKDPEISYQDGSFKRLADLIRVFLDVKVDHIRINVVSSDTQMAAP